MKTFKGKYIFVGDSHLVFMSQAIGKRSDTKFIAKKRMKYDWLKNEAGPLLKQYLKRNPNVTVVLCLGVNDLWDVKLYINYYKKLMKQFPKTKFYVQSVLPMKQAAPGHIQRYPSRNIRIRLFNKKMHAAFPNQYIPSYGFLTREGRYQTTDGLHLTAGSYRVLYRYIIRWLDKNIVS